MKYQVELVWNREFHLSFGSPKETLERAIKSAESIMDSGDGAGVKKARVIDIESGDVVWGG